MFILVIIIHIIVSIVLVGSVLLQVGKGASIGSTFGGASSQTLFGSAGPTTFLGKVTGACAALFMLTSLYLTYTSSHRSTSSIMGGVPTVSAPAAPQASTPPEEFPVKAPGAAKEAAPEKAPAAPKK